MSDTPADFEKLMRPAPSNWWTSLLGIPLEGPSNSVSPLTPPSKEKKGSTPQSEASGSCKEKVENFPELSPAQSSTMQDHAVTLPDPFIEPPRMDPAPLPRTPSPRPFIQSQNFNRPRQHSSPIHLYVRSSLGHDSDFVYLAPPGFDHSAFYYSLPLVTETMDYRRDAMFHFDGMLCEPLYWQDMVESNAFLEINDDGFDKKLIINVFEAPAHIAREGTVYVFGYDLGEQQLFLRAFSKFPGSVRDIVSVWEEGVVVYEFTINTVRSILSEGPKLLNGELAVSMLGNSPYSDPGIEIIFLLLSSQWVIDFAEFVYWSKTPEEVKQSNDVLTDMLHTWRDALEVGSKCSVEAAGEGFDKDSLVEDQNSPSGQGVDVQSDGHSHPNAATDSTLKDMLKFMLNVVEEHPDIENDAVCQQACNLLDEMTKVAKENK
jgi:hypothetical protein